METAAGRSALGACAWCGGSFVPNTLGHPRRYCSIACRIDAGHYREDLPRWTARLAELEASAATHRRGPVPALILNEIRDLRCRIDAGPASMRGAS